MDLKDWRGVLISSKEFDRGAPKPTAPNIDGERAPRASGRIAHALLLLAFVGASASADVSPDTLLNAAWGGELQSVRAAVSAGADLQAADDYDNTALHKAAFKGYVEIIEELLTAGANPLATNQGGETPAQLTERFSSVNHRRGGKMLAEAATAAAAGKEL